MSLRTTFTSLAGAGLGLIGTITLGGAPAQAICLSGTLNTTGNTCSTFNNTGTNTATVLLTDAGLNSAQYLQIGFASQSLGSTPPPTQSSGFSITDIQYSLDNTNYTPFNAAGSGIVNQDISNNAASSFTALYTPFFQLPNPLPASNTNLYVRYTLPSTITTNGQQIDIYVRSNVNGNQQASPNSLDAAGTPLLSTAANNQGNLATRFSTLDLNPPPPPASDVPAPLPLLGAGAAFSASRRLRKRISA